MKDQKPWYTSKAIWGSIIAMLAGIATMAGLKLDAPLQDQLAELITAAIEIGASGFAWYGRATATTQIAPSVVAKP